MKEEDYGDSTSIAQSQDTGEDDALADLAAHSLQLSSTLDLDTPSTTSHLDSSIAPSQSLEQNSYFSEASTTARTCGHSSGHRARVAEMKKFMNDWRQQNDLREFHEILNRSDHIRRSLAIGDIVSSKRIPFKVDGIVPAPTLQSSASYRQLDVSEDHGMMKMASVDSLPAVLPASVLTNNNSSGKRVSISTEVSSKRPTSANKTASASKSKTASSSKQSTTTAGSSSGAGGNSTNKSKKRVTTQMLKEIEYEQELKEENEKKSLDAKLQHVLKMLETAKQDLNPSLLYFNSGEIFLQLKVYERASFCYEKACGMSDAAVIIDRLVMPEDEAYRRKVERMSPLVLPQFLAQRQETRKQLIYEEYERQRERKISSHCILFQIYTVIALEMRDMWKAQNHLRDAFVTCKTEDEHQQLLVFFHRGLVALSDHTNGQAELPYQKQIIRSSAGPLAEAHITILHDLETIDPQNAEYQDWLGKRYAEKCMFEESTIHYKNARDILRIKPDMREILELWRKPANADTEENRELQDTIKNSVIKHKLVLYHTVKTITQEEVPIEAEEVFEEKKKKTKKQAAKRGKKATETLPPKPTTKTITHVDLSRSVMAQEVPDDAYSADNVNNRDPSNKKDMAWFGGCHQDATTILYTPPPRGWRWKNPDGTVSGELV